MPLLQIELTENAIRRIYSGDLVENPRLQANHISTQLASPSGEDRYRMHLSDGDHSLEAILSRNQTALLKEVEKYYKFPLLEQSVVRLGKYVCLSNKGRSIIFVDSLEIVVGHAPTFGSPKRIDDNSPTSRMRKEIEQIDDRLRALQEEVQLWGLEQTSLESVNEELHALIEHKKRMLDMILKLEDPEERRMQEWVATRAVVVEATWDTEDKEQEWAAEQEVMEQEWAEEKEAFDEHLRTKSEKWAAMKKSPEQVAKESTGEEVGGRRSRKSKGRL